MCNLQSYLLSVLLYLCRRRHCQNHCRHRCLTLKTTTIPIATIKFFPDPLVTGTIGIVFFRSTSSKKNRHHQASHALPKVIYIDDTCSTRHQMILLTLHAPHAPTRLQKPTNIILLASVATSALAYINCHVINNLHLRHHPCHRSAS